MDASAYRTFACVCVARLAFGLGALTVAGCSGEEGYKVSLLFSPPELAERIDRIELSVVPSCVEEDALGSPPSTAVVRVELERGEPWSGLGDVDDGEYGLYARGIGGCVGAAGCIPIVVAPDRERVFNVTLHEIRASVFDPSLPDDGGCGDEATCVEREGDDAICECPNDLEFDGDTCVPMVGEGEHEESFLSDWVWFVDDNGAGAVERDRSNGGSQHGDGNPIRIRGTTYDKGIGTNAPSEVRINLDDRCSRFRSIVGIDDEVSGEGEAEVEIVLDDESVYRSGTLTGDSAPEMIDLDLRGGLDLRLLVHDLGDRENDHVDWATARVDCEEGWRGDTIPTNLTDGWLMSATNGSGPIERDASNGGDAIRDGSTLTLNSQTFPRGIGTHAPSEIEIDIGGYCRRFTSLVGIDDEVEDGGSVVFQVWGDETLLFESDTMTAVSSPEIVSVRLDGYSKLRLVATEAGDGKVGDHADWARAVLFCASGWKGQRVPSFVSDWVFELAENGLGPVERNTSVGGELGLDGEPLIINGHGHNRGIGTHAPSRIRLKLGERCTRFFSYVAMDDTALPGADVSGAIFRVYADLSLIYESEIKKPGDPADTIDTYIGNRSTLTLEVDSAGDATWDYADWLETQLLCEPGTIGL